MQSLQFTAAYLGGTAGTVGDNAGKVVTYQIGASATLNKAILELTFGMGLTGVSMHSATGFVVVTTDSTIAGSSFQVSNSPFADQTSGLTAGRHKHSQTILNLINTSQVGNILGILTCSGVYGERCTITSSDHAQLPLTLPTSGNIYVMIGFYSQALMTDTTNMPTMIANATLTMTDNFAKIYPTIISTTDVNISKVGGNTLSGGNLPTNIEAVNGSDVTNTGLPINIKSINDSLIAVTTHLPVLLASVSTDNEVCVKYTSTNNVPVYIKGLKDTALSTAALPVTGGGGGSGGDVNLASIGGTAVGPSNPLFTKLI